MKQNDQDKLVAVARVVKPQGRRGEVVAELLTDSPSRLQETGPMLLGNPDDGLQPVEVENFWPHKGRIVLKLSGIESIDQAERLRGLHLFVRSEAQMPPPAHRYFISELLNCLVVREHDGMQQEVGVVTSVEATGGVDLLHVATSRGEVLIPLAQAICTRIDPEAHTIVIDPPEGLLDLNV